MKRKGKFWNREYRQSEHLALSTAPSEDLQKFTRWLGRRMSDIPGCLTSDAFVVDLGSGNGRNLIWLVREFGCRGVGYDASEEAVRQAKARAEKDFGLTFPGADRVKAKSSSAADRPDFASPRFAVRSLAEPLPVADGSADLVLDLMTSHVLDRKGRENLRDDIWRILKPGGWFCFKSFLLEDDAHARRLLREHGTGEAGTYHHPEFDQDEHVWTIEELENFFRPQFEIHKILKSHKHRSRGRAFRRRTFTAYLEKMF